VYDTLQSIPVKSSGGGKNRRQDNDAVGVVIIAGIGPWMSFLS